MTTVVSSTWRDVRSRVDVNETRVAAHKSAHGRAVGRSRLRRSSRARGLFVPVVSLVVGAAVVALLLWVAGDGAHIDPATEKPQATSMATTITAGLGGLFIAAHLLLAAWFGERRR